MPTLNEHQKYLAPYIEKYQNLLSEILDSITDFRSGCGNPRLITQAEKEFLRIQFYTSLQNNLHCFLPYEQARDIYQVIIDSHRIISPLTDVEGYIKYRDDSLFENDIEITLLRALYATREILKPETESSSGQTEARGEEKTAEKEARVKLSKEQQALAILVRHPHWTNKQIAKEVDVHEKTLSRKSWILFRKARAAQETQRQFYNRQKE
jgi:hypothetical protein